VGLVIFDALCRAGNALDALRELETPGSDAWASLTDMVQQIDAMIDLLVLSAPLGGDDAD
jgi:hypothetical protein